MSSAPRYIELTLATYPDETARESAWLAWRHWWFVTGVVLLAVFLTS